MKSKKEGTLMKMKKMKIIGSMKMAKMREPA